MAMVPARWVPRLNDLCSRLIATKLPVFRLDDLRVLPAEIKLQIANAFFQYRSQQSYLLPDELICESMGEVTLKNHPRVNEYIDKLVSAGCRQIRSLDLSRSKVSENSMRTLQGVAISSLSLNLNSRVLTNHVLYEFFSNHKYPLAFHRLHLAYLPIQETTLEVIAQRCTHLVHIDLSGCQLVGNQAVAALASKLPNCHVSHIM